MPFEKFLERINEEIDKIRKKPTRKGGKENRYDIWKNSDNRYALPMPSQNKLGVFANSVATYSARVYTIGVLKNNVYYVPIKRTEAIEILWARTVDKYIPLRFAAVGEHIFAYVSFNNKDWVPVEPRSVSDREVGEHMSLRGKVLKKINDSRRVKLEAIDTIMLETHKGTVSVDEFFERYDELTDVMSQQPDNAKSTPAPQNGVNKPPQNPKQSEQVIPGSDSQHDPLGEQRQADGPSSNENEAAGNSDHPADTRRALDSKMTGDGQRQDDQESSVRAHTSDSDQEETPLPIPPPEVALEGQNSEQRDTSGITADEVSESRNTSSTTSPQPPSDNYAAHLRERFQRNKNNANK